MKKNLRDIFGSMKKKKKSDDPSLKSMDKLGREAESASGLIPLFSKIAKRKNAITNKRGTGGG